MSEPLTPSTKTTPETRANLRELAYTASVKGKLLLELLDDAEECARLFATVRERDTTIEELRYRLQTWDDTHAEQVEQLRRELAEERADKERLNWLTREWKKEDDVPVVLVEGNFVPTADGKYKRGLTLREAIDAARAQKPEGK